jgi:hypothetical protein
MNIQQWVAASSEVKDTQYYGNEAGIFGRFSRVFAKTGALSAFREILRTMRDEEFYYKTS